MIHGFPNPNRWVHCDSGINFHGCLAEDITIHCRRLNCTSGAPAPWCGREWSDTRTNGVIATIRRYKSRHKRYAVIDLQAVSELSGFVDVADFRKAHREWIANALARGAAVKEDRWSETIAVGGQAFVEEVKKALGTRALHR